MIQLPVQIQGRDSIVRRFCSLHFYTYLEIDFCRICAPLNPAPEQPFADSLSLSLSYSCIRNVCHSRGRTTWWERSRGLARHLRHEKCSHISFGLRLPGPSTSVRLSGLFKRPSREGGTGEVFQLKGLMVGKDEGDASLHPRARTGRRVGSLSKTDGERGTIATGGEAAPRRDRRRTEKAEFFGTSFCRCRTRAKKF